MELPDHQGLHNINNAHTQNGIIVLNTNEVVIAQNRLLTQTVNELIKKLSKRSQQLKEMHENLKQMHIKLLESCNKYHPTGFPPE